MSSPAAGPQPPLIFGVDPQPALAQAVAKQLGLALAPHELRRFDDGEFKLRPLVCPAGRRCAIVTSLHADADTSPQDRLIRLLLLVTALRDHGAQEVSVIAPYLCYTRKDRRSQALDPVSLRALAQWLEASGATRLITVEAHDRAAFDNAFRIRAQSLPLHAVLGATALGLLDGGPLAIATPDTGGFKRAQLWREHWSSQAPVSAEVIVITKRRRAGELEGPARVCGELARGTVLLVDDLVASGATLARACEALRAAGARRVMAAAAHGLFSADALKRLSQAGLHTMLVSDSINATIGAAPIVPLTLVRSSCAPALAAAFEERAQPSADQPLAAASAAPR